MTQAVIALGGNVGNSAELFQFAVSKLANLRETTVLNCSGLYETAPIGQQAGETFCNAATVIDTEQTPESLLELCLQIEDLAGRTRQLHWGPRTLDLDLILYGSTIRESSELMIPHPACWYRRFVLDPVAEIAAHWVHPLFQLTVADLKQRLLDRPLTMDVSRLEKVRQQQLVRQLQTRFDDSQLQLIDQGGMQPPNWSLHAGAPDSYSELRFAQLYEQHLPGTFEEYLPDVVTAAVDKPHRLTAQIEIP